jgi:geranylgeranyl pyrophosphate synthase
MFDFSEKAKKSLDVLRDSHAKTILRELADYSISREK